MKLNNLPFRVYGDIGFRGNCPSESAEQIAFFSWLRREYPEYGDIATHIRNEGVRKGKQAATHHMEGMVNGASDIIIPCKTPFVCEMKRQDHTKSKWQEGQIGYLENSQNKGAFACVALGFTAAKAAFTEYLECTKI